MREAGLEQWLMMGFKSFGPVWDSFQDLIQVLSGYKHNTVHEERFT